MMFSDGGYRPGYNVQYATDTGSGFIVGVEVTNEATDNEQMPPMLAHQVLYHPPRPVTRRAPRDPAAVRRRLGQHPAPRHRL
jgi:hypothetical protein